MAPPRYRHKKRTWGAILCFVGVLLLVVSLAVPWYSIAVNTGNGTTVTTSEMYLEGEFVTGCTGTCPRNYPVTAAYMSSQLINVGNVFASAEAFTILALLVSLVALAGAGLAALGSLNRRSFHSVALASMLGVVVLSLVVTLGMVAYLPAAYNQDTGGNSPTPSPGTSFWSSCSGTSTSSQGACGPGISMNWGPSAGWFMLWVVVALFLISFILFWTSRRDPVTRSEIEGAAPGTFTFTPLWSRLRRPVSLTPSMACRQCGASNPAGAARCGRCGTRL
jgi:hypothetical protein